MNGQIVICPGWNDGDQLRRTLRDLTEWQFSSCSLVPVGITKYRQGLAKLRPVSAEDARDIIAIAEEFGQENLRRFGTRRVGAVPVFLRILPSAERAGTPVAVPFRRLLSLSADGVWMYHTAAGSSVSAFAASGAALPSKGVSSSSGLRMCFRKSL